MFRTHDEYLRMFGRLHLDPDKEGAGGGGNTEGKPGGETTPPDPLDGLTDAQKAVIQKQIDSAAAKARRDGETAGKTKAQQEADAKAEADRVAKEQADALKAGEFDKVRIALEQDRDTHKSELEKAKASLTAAEAELAAVVADRVKELEATKDKALIDAFPKDASPLEQLKWLNDPRTKAAMKTADESQRVTDAKDKFRTPASPKPDAAAQNKELQQRTANRFARQYTG